MKSLREQYNEHMTNWSPTIDELPGDLKEIAECLAEKWPDDALAMTLHLYSRFPKVHVYFHNLDQLRKEHRDSWIKSLPRKVNGQQISIRDIALATGLSSREVDKIRPPLDKGDQLPLFPEKNEHTK